MGFVKHLNQRREEKEKSRHDIENRLESIKQPSKTIDVVPIIDRDISKAYVKELSPVNIMDSQDSQTRRVNFMESPNR